MRERGERLLAVDALRGVAVILVLLAHLPFSLNALPVRTTDVIAANAFPPAVVTATDFGRFGVNLFLVISGFCIHMRWARVGDVRSHVDFLGFWRRRLVRLYPPYAVAAAASLLGLFVAFGVLSRATTPAGAFGYGSFAELGADLVVLALLLQNLTDASSRIGNGPFWTLALEEQLYLLYFPLLWLRRRVGWAGALVAVTAVTLAWRAAPLLADGLSAHWLILGPARWLEWGLGALAVEAYLGLVRLPRWCASFPVGVAFAAAAVLANLPGIARAVPAISLVSDPLFGLAFFVLLNRLVTLDSLGALAANRAVALLGAVGLFSYSLYLTHTPVVVAGKVLAFRLGLVPEGPQLLAIVAIRFALAIAAAYFFYRLIELPAIRASRRLRPAARTAPPAP